MQKRSQLTTSSLSMSLAVPALLLCLLLCLLLMLGLGREARAQTTFASDSFTGTAGTALESHTATSGGPWVKHPSSGNTLVLTGTGGVNGSSSTNQLYYITATPATTEYDVIATMNATSGSYSDIASHLDTSVFNCYLAGTFNGNWVIYKETGGNNSVVATGSTYPVNTNAVVDLRTRLSGSNLLVSMYVNGTLNTSWLDTAPFPAGHAGIFEYTNSTVWSNFSATNPAATPLTIGTLSFTSTPTTITLALNASLAGGSGTGYNYKVWRDIQPVVSTSGTPYATPASFPWTDSGLAAATSYWYKVIGYDSSATSIGAFPAGLGTATGPLGIATITLGQTVGVVEEGDSVTYGAQAGPGVGPSASLQSELAMRNGIRSVVVYDKGVSGYDTTNWIPTGSTFLGAASPIAANNSAAYQFTQANPTGQLVFSIDLGINDGAVSGNANGPKTQAVYKASLKAMVDQHLSDWPNVVVVLNYPTYFSPDAQTSYVYGEGGLANVLLYQQAISQLVVSYGVSNPGKVFLGDTKAFGYFEANYLTDLTAESGSAGTFYLHPNVQGNLDLGKFWATAIYNALYTTKASGGTKRRIQ